MLFVTNIVAIILGTAISLRLVGIRDAHHHGTTQLWSRRFVGLLLGAVVALAFAVSHKAPRTGQAAIDDLRTKIATAVSELSSDAMVVSATTTAQSELSVVVESPVDELGDVPQKIHDVAVAHFADENLRVKLEVRHVVEVDKRVEEPAKPAEPAPSDVAPEPPTANPVLIPDGGAEPRDATTGLDAAAGLETENPETEPAATAEVGE